MTPTVASLAPLLIVTTRPDAIGPARMPRELKRAGFPVAMLAVRGALATDTRFVDQIGYLPPDPTLRQWIEGLAGAVRAIRPVLVLPGDEVSLRLLLQLAVEPPAQLQEDLRRELQAIARRSVGDAGKVAAAIDATRLPTLAEAAGVRVPEGAVADDARGALEVAARLGYPVVLCPAQSVASGRVSYCRDPAALTAAFAGLPHPLAWHPGGGARARVERPVDGSGFARTVVAWQGRELAGVSWERASVDGDGRPAFAARYAADPELADFSRRMVSAMNASGFFEFVFRVDRRAGGAFLLEVSACMSAATHTGRVVGVDLARALADAVRGDPGGVPGDLAPDTEHRLALFPQEWLRDRTSAAFRSLPSDVPWDDPGLVKRLLDLAGAGG
jgi:hypothetical protein